jgi:hypothetical protein
VDRRDFPDPWILRAGAAYYAYATQAGSTNVQVMRSHDLATWDHLGDALPALPAWAAPGRTWSPAVLERGDDYVLYYTVREPRSDRQCISVATAGRPEGPFSDHRGGPLMFQLERGGSIDPSPFVDGDGTAYLYWKSDDNALHWPSSIWAAPLAPDGLSLAAAATELLRHDRAWERPLIEAPSLVLHGGRYFLFYSAQWWESDGYAVGYATGRHPLGRFRKDTRSRPWLAAGEQAVGPGGQEFFTGGDGALHMCYHAWAPGAVGYHAGGVRSLHLARIDFTGGRPTIV